MPQAIIFDIDGTLLDSVNQHARAWQEAFAHFGKKVGFQEVHDQIGKGGDQLLPVFLSKEEQEKFGKQLEEYRAQLFKEKYLPEVKPFPGVRALFERLKGDGFRLALASSGKKEEVEKYEQIAGIQDLVEKKTSSTEAKHSKPEPDIFSAALEKLGLPAQECVAVGDSPYDAEAAGKIKLPALGVRSGGFPTEWLDKAGYRAVYDDVSDLLAHYKQAFGNGNRGSLQTGATGPKQENW